MELFDRLTGTVRSFNPRRGFGFINPSDGSPEIFVHYLDIQGDGFKSLTPGEMVEFDVAVDSTQRRRAADVTGPNGAAIHPSIPPRNDRMNNYNNNYGGGYQQQNAFGGGGYNGMSQQGGGYRGGGGGQGGGYQQRYQRSGPSGYNNNYGNNNGNYRGDRRGGDRRGGGGRGGYGQQQQAPPAMFEQDGAFGDNMPQQVDDFMNQNYDMPLSSDDLPFDQQ